VSISFNEALLFAGDNKERLNLVWDSLADVVLADRVLVHFFELELDHAAAASGFLRHVDVGGSQSTSIDITTELQALARSLLESGKPRNRSVDIELRQSLIHRSSETSSFFACGLEIQRRPDRLAIMDLSGSADSAPLLALHDASVNGDPAGGVVDDSVFFNGAFGRYQESVKRVHAPLMVGSSASDEGLSWSSSAAADFGEVTFPPRSLWRIPQPPSSVENVRLVGFACAAPLLSTVGHTLYENLAEALRLIQLGALGPIAGTPASIELLDLLDETVFLQGALVDGYESTRDASGAWTRLLSVLASRMDVVHGDLGSISSAARQALPGAIPFHPSWDQLTLGAEDGEYSVRIGRVVRDALVRFWRTNPELAWNQTAAWVSAVSTLDG